VPRRDAELREALGRFLSGPQSTPSVRPEILDSWRRVASNGLEPERFDPAYGPDVESGSRLERAALPVLDQLSDDLAGTETSLVLTDEHAHVLDRRVSDRTLLALLDDIHLAPGFYYDEHGAGTNGIGSALALHGPAIVRGGEHFADVLTGMACAAAPVMDPRTAQVVGIIDVTVRATHANALMLPFAKRAAWEIEQGLLDGASAIEHLLHERFLAARRRVKGPFAVVSEHAVLSNTAAARILDPADHPRLWQLVTTAVLGGRQPRDVSGVAITACEPIHDGDAFVGALVTLAVPNPRGDTSPLGWASLTDSERSIADLVADGLTNREVGSRLFLSPHTVDAHLRHIFRKLDIRSRVEFARMVAEHADSRPPEPRFS
jgi:transcriptional regulator of acetoin/glycerol metabolism/DNA-binding CsgD family transcriptional regulator